MKSKGQFLVRKSIVTSSKDLFLTFGTKLLRSIFKKIQITKSVFSRSPLLFSLFLSVFLSFHKLLKADKQPFI